jgi:Paraquat-inducible protein A
MQQPFGVRWPPSMTSHRPQYRPGVVSAFSARVACVTDFVGRSIMLVATQTWRSGWLRDRRPLYYVVRWIGRWLMIDILMQALLSALVQFGTVITIEPGIGAVAFCGVVIPIIFAAETFAPCENVGRSSPTLGVTSRSRASPSVIEQKAGIRRRDARGSLSRYAEAAFTGPRSQDRTGYRFCSCFLTDTCRMLRSARPVHIGPIMLRRGGS